MAMRVEPRTGDRVIITMQYANPFLGSRGLYMGKEPNSREEDTQKYMVRIDDDPTPRVFTLADMTHLEDYEERFINTPHTAYTLGNTIRIIGPYKHDKFLRDMFLGKLGIIIKIIPDFWETEPYVVQVEGIRGGRLFGDKELELIDKKPKCYRYSEKDEKTILFDRKEKILQRTQRGYEYTFDDGRVLIVDCDRYEDEVSKTMKRMLSEIHYSLIPSEIANLLREYEKNNYTKYREYETYATKELSNVDLWLPEAVEIGSDGLPLGKKKKSILPWKNATKYNNPSVYIMRNL